MLWTHIETQVHFRYYIYNSLPKMMEKWPVLWTIPKSTWLLLSCFIIIRIRWDFFKWCIAAISSLRQPNPKFPAQIVAKVFYPALWGMTCSPPRDAMLKVCYYTILYFHVKCSDKLHSLLLLIQIFTVKNHFASYSNVRRKFHSDSILPRETTLYDRHQCGCSLHHEHYNLSKSTVSPYITFIFI